MATMIIDLSIINRFWEKVNVCTHSQYCEQCCWEWKGAVDRRGYGVFTLRVMDNGEKKWRIQRANRVLWKIVYGDIPEGHNILHRCDNPPCNNPSHLWTGTAGDNVHDAQKKGRLATGDRNGMRLYPERRPRGMNHGSYTHPEQLERGEDRYNAKLTEANVQAIRQEAQQGKTYTALSKQFGTSRTNITFIVKRQAWKHVE